MTKINMLRFGSIREKTQHHEKKTLADGVHFVCKWLNCPHNIDGLCKCIIIDDSIDVIYCFCG